MDRNEWLQQRRTCITGTDIGAICGINKYQSAIDVFMDKLGLADPIKENEAMRWGSLLEPVIAERYARDHGFELKKGEFIKRGLFGGTPDYLTKDRLLEVKTAGIYAAKNFGDEGTDQVPDSYMTQVQWYLGLTDLPVADLAVLIAGQDYRIYTIERNQRLIELLQTKAECFWHDHVVPKIPPQFSSSDNSERYLKEFYPTNKTSTMIAPTPEIVGMIDELQRLKGVNKESSEQIKRLENEIKFFIGDNDGVSGSYFKATWKKSKDSNVVDWEGVARELDVDPDLVERYTAIKSGSRRFLLSFNQSSERGKLV